MDYWGFAEGGDAAREMAPGWMASEVREAVPALKSEVAGGGGDAFAVLGVDGQLFDTSWTRGAEGGCSGGCGCGGACRGGCSGKCRGCGGLDRMSERVLLDTGGDAVEEPVMPDIPMTWGWGFPLGDCTCPEECIALHAKAVSCYTECGKAHPGSRKHRVSMRKRCNNKCHKMAEDYWQCVVDSVQERAWCCPELTYSQVASRDPLICGPDITDELMAAVVGDWWSIYEERASGVWLRWRERGPRDWKRDVDQMDEQEAGNCGSCGWTYTLCGYCVKADVPANIGAAAAIGGRRVREFAAHSLYFGEEDSWDSQSYDIGDAWRESQSEDSTFDLVVPREGMTRKELCKAVADAAAKSKRDESTKGDSPFRNCLPCAEKYKAS